MDYERSFGDTSERIMRVLQERGHSNIARLSELLKEIPTLVFAMLVMLRHEGRVIRKVDGEWCQSLSERNRIRHRRRFDAGVVSALDIFPKPSRKVAETTKHIGFFGPTRRTR